MPALSPHLIAQHPRARELRRRRAYLRSKQYEGRPDFWSGRGPKGEVVPLRERAPHVIYPLPYIMVRQLGAFMFGEDRYPTVTVERAEDDTFLYDISLTEDEAKQLEAGAREIERNAALRARILDVAEEGLAVGTVVVIYSVRDGKIHLETAAAEDCWPEFEGDDPRRSLVRLTWCYQYDATVEEDGVLKTRRMWFRREYDAEAVTSWEPVPVKLTVSGVAPPEWGEPRVEPHGLGIIPCRWIRNDPETARAGAVDGQSIYGSEACYAGFDDLNFALSQRSRGIKLFGTPQPYETGVEEDDTPGTGGRTATASAYRPAAGDKPPRYGEVVGPARRMSPDYIWSYKSPNVRLGLLEVSGKAFEVASAHVDDITKRLENTIGVLAAHPGDMLAKGQGGLNARLLALLYAPTLALVARYRDKVWWTEGLGAIYSDLLRIIANVGGRGVHLVGAQRLAELLQRFYVETDAGRRWIDPPLSPAWGDSFTPANDEIKMGTDAAIAANTGGLIAKETASKFVAGYYGVRDVAAELEKHQETLDEHAERDGARQAASMEKTEAVKAKFAPPKPPPPLNQKG